MTECGCRVALGTLRLASTMQQAGVIDPAPVPGAGGVGTTAGASSGAPQERPAAAFSVLSNERGTEVEDTFVLMDDLNLEVPAALRKAGVQCSAPTVRLFGVYDGHGGNGVAAKHCARRLHYFVAEQLQAILRRHAAETPVVTEVCPLDTPVVVGALREAFVATDAELKASGVLEHSSGSTAVVALLTRASIWLAWAGRDHPGFCARKLGCSTCAARVPTMQHVFKMFIMAVHCYFASVCGCSRCMSWFGLLCERAHTRTHTRAVGEKNHARATS